MEKTVLVSGGRCGTHMIWCALKQAGYLAIGEPINAGFNNLQYPDLVRKYGVVGTKLNTQFHKLMNRGYIEDTFARCDMCSIQYYHINDDIMDYLLNNIRIIHLKRKNRLLRYVSSMHARETNSWVVFDKKPPVIPVEIDIQAALNDFKFMEGQERRFNGVGLDLFYEESENWPEFINKILMYTGEKVADIKLVTKKQLEAHPSTYIRNYEAVLATEGMKEYV